MSTGTTSAHLQPETLGTKLRHAVVGALFAVVLVLPKILRLRRSPRAWTFCRILIGLAGAGLVVLPVARSNSYVPAVLGLTMFIAAILLPAMKPVVSVDEKAHELGALVVVNGGRLRTPDSHSTSVQLFVGTEKISALDKRHQPILTIPVDQIILVHAEESAGCWLLSVTWGDYAAQFSYRGIFAEHLARVAETTLRSVMRQAFPVLPQRRAAGA